MNKVKKLEQIISLVAEQVRVVKDVNQLLIQSDQEELQEELMISVVNMTNNASNILTAQMYALVEGEEERIPVENIIDAGKMLTHTLNLEALDQDYEEDGYDHPPDEDIDDDSD